MWSGFPLYSEGCGSGTDLWQGRAALERTGDFLRQASALSRARPGAPRGRQGNGTGAPQVNILYDHPTGARPWLQVPPLSLASALPPRGDDGCGSSSGAAAAGPEAAWAPPAAPAAEGAAAAFEEAWQSGLRARSLPQAPQPLSETTGAVGAEGARPGSAASGQRLRSALDVTPAAGAEVGRRGDDAACAGCGLRPYLAGAVIGSAVTLAALAVARHRSDLAGSQDALGVLLECWSGLALPDCKAHEYERVGSAADVLRGEPEPYEHASPRELEDLPTLTSRGRPRSSSPLALPLEPAGAGWSYGGQGAPELWRRSEAPAWTPRRREEAEPRRAAAGPPAPGGWSLLSLLPEALWPAAGRPPPARAVAAARRGPPAGGAAPCSPREPRCASRGPAPGRSPRGAEPWGGGGGRSPRSPSPGRFVAADDRRFVEQRSPRWGAGPSP
ncbi:unnamed protein product, partial [Prorocentrum cordatum]